MSRGHGAVMSAILKGLTSDWTDIDTLARRAFGLSEQDAISSSRISSATRAAHRLEAQGLAELSLLPLTTAGTGRNGKPLGPSYLHVRRTEAGEQRQEAVIENEAIALRRREASRSWEAAQGVRDAGQAPAGPRDIVGLRAIQRAVKMKRNLEHFQSLCERGDADNLAGAWDLKARHEIWLATRLLGGLQRLQGLYEDEAAADIPEPVTGEKLSLWDVKALYERRLWLSRRDSMLIEVGLYHDLDPENPRLKGAVRRLLKVSES